MFIQNLRMILTASFCLIYVGNLIGCTSSEVSTPSQIHQTPTSCSTSQPTTGPVNLPQFLVSIHPAPGSVIKQECYLEELNEFSTQVGIYAIIFVEPMVEPGDNLVDLDIIDERISISVDTVSEGDTPTYFGADLMLLQKYDEETKVITRWGGPHVWKSFPVILSPGKHTATVRLRKTSGAILEYSWTFTIEP